MKTLLLLLASAVGWAQLGPQPGPLDDRIRQQINSGKYHETEPLVRQMLADAEAQDGAESAAVGRALDFLIEITSRAGKKVGPEERAMAARAIAVKEKVYGENSRQAARTIRLVADLYMEGKDFQMARSYAERAVAISESLHNEVDFDIERAIAFDTLGMAMMNNDDLPAAKANFEKAAALVEKVQGPDSPRLGAMLNNVAAAMLKMRDYEGARPLFARALAISEKQYGPDHPNVAAALSNLGNVLTHLGRGAEAAVVLERALRIAQASFGPWNYRVAVVSANLGAALQLAAKYDDAAVQFQRTREIYEKVQGPESAEAAFAHTHIAVNLALAGKTAEAIESAVRSETLIRAYDENTMRSIPEREALLHASARNAGIRANGLNVLLSLAAVHAPAKPALDQLIRSRADVFDEMASRHNAGASSGDPEIERRSAALAKAREDLAALVLKGQGSTPAAQYAAELAQARARKEDAERALAEKSESFRQQVQGARAGIEEVAAALPKGTALVSYALYRRRSFLLNAPTAAPDPQTHLSYIALILRAGDPEPSAVSLGLATEVDALVKAVREKVAAEAADPGRAPQRSEQLYREAAARLRQAIWDPVAPLVAGSERVYIVPDGNLSPVNFAALPVGATAYLIEQGPLLHYLSTERDLLTPASRGANGLLALGNPAFDRHPTAATASLRGANCSAFQNMRFDRLPDSAREVQDVAALWRQSGEGEALTLTGAAASKDAFFRRAEHRKVLHLATHGFFLGAQCGQSGQGQSNPLLLSGLVLAGANERADAGILTAEEIAGLNLDGVDWVVLSACDTALGEYLPGEGVFGLRRAFQLAGARTVIMSVWPVEDSVTLSWMHALYSNRFTRHLDTAEAVHQASLTMLRARRKAGESTHPLYWGGFIAAGGW